MHNGEKQGGPARSFESFETFENMIKDCKVKELPSHGNSFNWGGRRHSLGIQCKLDRSFVNNDWLSLFPVSNQSFLEKRGSDHRPVLLVNLLASQEVYRGQFKFDRRMLHKPMVKECVKRDWNSQWFKDGLTISNRTRRCRKTLSRWKKRT